MRIQFTKHTPGSVHLIGHPGLNGAGTEGADAAGAFAVKDFDAFTQRVTDCGGNFATAVHKGSELWAAVDRVRSLPLFYGQAYGSFAISDDAYWVKEFIGAGGPAAVPAAELWYMLYVLGDRTLAAGVRQLRPGEAIRVRANNHGFQVRRHRYYRYMQRPAYPDDQQALMKWLDEAHIEVFEQLLASVGPRQLVVPLSGGLDSRLCACMLKRLGAKNVLCFTYGRPGNREARVSRFVAKRLGYPWTFVSYRQVDWDADDCRADLKRFFRFSCNLAALPPALEDWIAVREMRRTGQLDRDAVFCPGHTAAFSMGSRLASAVAAAADREDLVSVILRQHSPRLRWERPSWPILEAIRHDIRRTLDELRPADGDGGWDPVALFDGWNWAERQGKRIINMVRGYEFWSYGWRVPLWDRRLMDFWTRVPQSCRQSKDLYHRYLRAYSDRALLGLFDPNDRRLQGSGRSRSGTMRLVRKALGAHSAGRYFMADKGLERLLSGNYARYLQSVGRRVFSPEPVTCPWLLLETCGLPGLWDPAAA